MKHHIFIFTEDITLDGGVERVVSNMANSFSKRGYPVNIISLFKANKGIKYAIDSKVKIKFIYENESFEKWVKHRFIKYNLYCRYRLSASFTPKLYSYIEKEIAGSESAVLLCNSYLITPLFHNSKIKIIGLDHSRYPFRNVTGRIRLLLHTFMVKKFDAITTLNKDELDKWKSIGPPVYIMPNFLPQNWINDNSSTSKRNKVILSMGRMNTDQKGFDRLIDAYALIARKHPDWKLEIYGSGVLQRQYKCQIQSMGMQNYININDFTANPKEEYQKASIYAMCSREEGFPMVLLEAGSMGLPIVSYDIEFGPRNVIKTGQTGYIIPDGDKEQFAQALEKLMIDDDLRERMSDTIRKDIPERFSEEVLMDKWIKLINSL